MLYVFLSFFFFLMYLSLKLLTISSSLSIVRNMYSVIYPQDNPSGALYLSASVWSGSFSRSYTHTHKCMSVYVCAYACLCLCMCVFDPGISHQCHSVNFTFLSSVLFLFPGPHVFLFLDLLNYNIQQWNITSSNSLRENIQQEHI